MHSLIMIAGKELRCDGTLVRVAGLAAPWYESIDDPEGLIRSIKQSSHRIDMLTFFQRPPHTTPLHEFYREPYDVAVVEIDSYETWYAKSIQKKARHAFRKSVKLGVDVRLVEFNEAFMRDVYAIYNETPLRQGRKFRHFGRSFEDLSADHATYPEKSCFIGAYHSNELIGFVKLIFERDFTDVLNILCKIAHRDKAAATCLIAKAVEICAQRECRYLAYGDWEGEGLGDFKRHAGFIRMELPRYYVPLTALGHAALGVGLHRPAAQLLPSGLRSRLKAWRRKWYDLSLKAGQRTVSVAPD